MANVVTIFSDQINIAIENTSPQVAISSYPIAINVSGDTTEVSISSTPIEVMAVNTKTNVSITNSTIQVAVDASGLPGGGEPYNVLAKVSGSSGDYAWFDLLALVPYSIMQFGAKCDGMTDDTDAVQAAIDSGNPIIFFPVGRTIVNTLNPVSNQIWRGYDRQHSVLAWLGTNRTNAAVNMIQQVSDLANVTWQDLGFEGNLLFQTSEDFTGQNLAAFQLREGSLENIRFTRCAIFHWGTQTTNAGFGIALGPNSGLNQSVDGIVIEDCDIYDNANVPGVYFNTTDTYTTSFGTVEINGCRISNSLPYAKQNMVFIVGTPELVATSLQVTNNIFTVNETVDTVCELNFSETYQVSDNTVIVNGSAHAVIFLFRSRVNGGQINGNILVNNSDSDSESLVAFSFVRQDFDTSDGQSRATLSGNTIVDFFGGIKFSDRTKGIKAVDNIIMGVNRTMHYAFACAGASDISMSKNTIINCDYILELGVGGTSPLRNITFDDNTIDDCGSTVPAGTDSLVTCDTTSMDAQGIRCTNNTVTNCKTIVTDLFFASYAFQAATGNVMINNTCDDTVFGTSNPSWGQYVAVFADPPVSNGVFLVGQNWKFQQGSIGLGVNWGDLQDPAFTIGENLDAFLFTEPGAVPNVNPGDAVMWGWIPLNGTDTFPEGILISAYVQETNKIRLRVRNDNNFGLDIPAGYWTITNMQQVAAT